MIKIDNTLEELKKLQEKPKDPSIKGIQFLISEEKYKQLIGIKSPRPVVNLHIDLKLLDPLPRRIALGLTSTHPADSGSLLTIEREAGRKIWEWDTLGDDETPQRYIERHVAQMGEVSRLWMANEPSHMTQKMYQQWASRMGYEIPYVTIVAFFKENARNQHGVKVVDTNLLMKYLIHWDKTKRPKQKPIPG